MATTYCLEPPLFAFVGLFSTVCFASGLYLSIGRTSGHWEGGRVVTSGPTALLTPFDSPLAEGMPQYDTARHDHIDEAWLHFIIILFIFLDAGQGDTKSKNQNLKNEIGQIFYF